MPTRRQVITSTCASLPLRLYYCGLARHSYLCRVKMRATQLSVSLTTPGFHQRFLPASTQSLALTNEAMITTPTKPWQPVVGRQSTSLATTGLVLSIYPYDSPSKDASSQLLTRLRRVPPDVKRSTYTAVANYGHRAWGLRQTAFGCSTYMRCSQPTR